MKFIDKLLNKLGLVRISYIGKFRDLSAEPFKAEELSLMLATLIGDTESDISPEEEQAVFAAAKNVEGLTEYLRKSAARDMARYFGAASAQEQFIIRGAFSRTNYLRTKILAGGKPTGSKLPGIRYT